MSHWRRNERDHYINEVLKRPRKRDPEDSTPRHRSSAAQDKRDRTRYEPRRLVLKIAAGVFIGSATLSIIEAVTTSKFRNGYENSDAVLKKTVSQSPAVYSSAIPSTPQRLPQPRGKWIGANDLEAGIGKAFHDYGAEVIARHTEQRRRQGYPIYSQQNPFVKKVPGRPLKECLKNKKVIDQEVMNCYEDHYEAVQ